ncbi:hypothetical protein GCM10027341_03440 [Spirosoma knui]
MRYYALVFLLLCVPAAYAQTSKPESYKIKIVTLEGDRFIGILDDVSQTAISLSNETSNGFRYEDGEVPLANVRKLVLRRNSRKKSAIQGGVVGALVLGYTVIQSSKKNGFRSPAVYSLNLGLAMVGGAATGGLLGYRIGPIARKVIRPRGRDREEARENLRRQLEPFTYSYQIDVLNRAQP